MATTVTPAAQLNLQTPVTAKERSMRSMIWNQFRRHRLAVAGLVVLAAMSFGAILVPYISPYPPELSSFQERREAMANKDMPPSLAHPMGTDPLGRDIMTRLLYGGRISLTIGLLATAVGILIGTVVGAVAGFYGGWVDNALMRLTDMFIALPRIFMLIIMSLLMRDLEWAILRPMAGRRIFDPRHPVVDERARGARAVSQLEGKEFVEAAPWASRTRVFGMCCPTSTPIIVAATLLVGATIISESGLSFLGFGVQPPTPTWGNMLNSAQNEMLSGHWWMAVFPGLMIFLTVISINYIGEGLRDALDPRKLK